ncbi:conserved hypothetical protein [Clostridium novyi NT]|uniref:Aspartyl-phosphate phosphatase Spo0E family protein n=2 Tax=Clostridiaceae TaxID=31979 RepID=A0Q219_CLONN|nr:conserved hypothetical protein [Clostridium novyi NT]
MKNIEKYGINRILGIYFDTDYFRLDRRGKKMYNMCEGYIKMQIEELRIKLNKLVDEKINSLVDMDVVKLSEKMDLLLLQYMKQQNNKRFLIKDF